MKSALAPKFTSPINKETFLVWFNTSNKYLFLNKNLKTLIDIYFESENQSIFFYKVNKSLGLPKEIALTYYKEITALLKECNKKLTPKKTSKRPFNKTKASQIKNYVIDNHYIRINYSSQEILNFLHNQIEHLATSNINNASHLDIDIQEDGLYFFLYVNKKFIDSYLKTNYHLLQGKFNLLLLNLIYKSNEEDWLAMLHGSSISNGKEAVIFVGHSGNGKSTFTTLMVANGYNLVTDDITPIHSTNNKVCSTPSGISIKEGAFDVLKTYKNNFKSSKEFIYSTKKGKSIYITTSPNYKKIMLPCNNIVLIKYDKGSDTKLTTISPKEILEVVIPDSWTSPIDENAKSLMKWIKELNYYQLCYSNSTEAIEKISTLFK